MCNMTQLEMALVRRIDRSIAVEHGQHTEHR